MGNGVNVFGNNLAVITIWAFVEWKSRENLGVGSEFEGNETLKALMKKFASWNIVEFKNKNILHKISTKALELREKREGMTNLFM